jgi:hypothetical protein
MTTVKARDYYPITGRSSTGGTFDRIPVEELKADHPYQWTLFVLGFAWINGTPIPFPGVVQPPLKTSLSLMEIGGIHGRPYREWAGDRRTHDEALADFSGVDKKDTNPSPSRFGGKVNVFNSSWLSLTLCARILQVCASHPIIGVPVLHEYLVMRRSLSHLGTAPTSCSSRFVDVKDFTSVR